MATINDGGPAYPNNDHNGCAYPGMTMRDYFAGQALIALIPEYDDIVSTTTKAYKLADAMIAACERQQKAGDE